MKKQNKRKRHFVRKTTSFYFVLIIVLIICTTGCMLSKPYKYEGKYPELYSVAINTLLGADGYILSEKRFDPEITLLEKDAYGRTLFLYFESKTVSRYSIIVIQKSDDQYSYFYPDYNFISASDSDLLMARIEELKSINDWDMAMNEDKCVKTELIREKASGPVSIRTLEDQYNKIFVEDAYNNVAAKITFLTTDYYGRSLYLGRGSKSSGNEDEYDRSGRYVVMLFNPDDSYDKNTDILALPDIYDYQEDLKAFKIANDWNMPFN